jgi:hypothetical protein
VQGIYNIASIENMTLSAIADLYKKQVTFGEFNYQVGNIATTKAIAILPAFQKTTKEIIQNV